MALKKNIVLKIFVLTCLVLTVLLTYSAKPCSASSDLESDSIISLSNDFVINQEEATLYTGGSSITGFPCNFF